MHLYKTAILRVLTICIAIGVGIGVTALAVDGGSRAYSSLFGKEAQKGATESLELTKTEVTEGPSYLIKRDVPLPKISAEAYLVGDISSGEIIVEKNPETPFPVASISKLMTALVSLGTFDQERITTASRRALATYGENGNFRVGEKITLGALLYPLLIESSNDAAEIIAETDDREQFITRMNATAAKLAMTNTTYVEPTGLSPENISTVRDLFILASHITKNQPLIFDISKVAKYSYKQHTWYNISQFLRARGYNGSKSGYIDEARQTNIGLFTLPLANGEEKKLTVILLKSADRKRDTDALLTYIKNNVYYGDTDAYPFAAPAEDLYKIPDDEIDLVFAGDIMLDRGVRQNVYAYFGGDYGRLFTHAPEVARADIAFANLEGPASDKGADEGSIYSFRMEPKSLIAVRDAGFDVLSVANNHAGDWGREAFSDTLLRIQNAGMEFVGGGGNRAEAKQPKIIEKKGIKIGYLGFSDVGPAWIRATETSPGILLANDPHFEQSIKDAAAQCDVLVVSFHWGEEYKTGEHTERQKDLAHRAIDAGAKLVIGHHPHVIQDTEHYNGGYIAYSLGNFIFDQAFSKDTMEGLLLSVRLKRSEILQVQKNIVKLNQRFQIEKVLEE
ncbi:MAG: CapA family protein [Candidatus Pacebacteria bacterium]|jgi:poly-gamma-glutamate synthesis protein (capsule biosynthesis protein)|nr:CapA family protein [Candidatus Paceibacterota bacterium]